MIIPGTGIGILIEDRLHPVRETQIDSIQIIQESIALTQETADLHFSRDTRGLSRGTTDSPRPMRDRDPWDRDDRGRGRDTNRDWRDRSPVRDRDMRERDRDRRRERDRFRPSPQNDQSRGKSTLKRYFTFKKR